MGAAVFLLVLIPRGHRLPARGATPTAACRCARRRPREHPHGASPGQRHVLVVANEALAGDALRERILGGNARASRSTCSRRCSPRIFTTASLTSTASSNGPGTPGALAGMGARAGHRRPRRGWRSERLDRDRGRAARLRRRRGHRRHASARARDLARAWRARASAPRTRHTCHARRRRRRRRLGVESPATPELGLGAVGPGGGKDSRRVATGSRRLAGGGAGGRTDGFGDACERDASTHRRLHRAAGRADPEPRLARAGGAHAAERACTLDLPARRGVDGVFGERTWHAVVAFQGWSGLVRDGIIGPKTRGRSPTRGGPRRGRRPLGLRSTSPSRCC